VRISGNYLLRKTNAPTSSNAEEGVVKPCFNFIEYGMGRFYLNFLINIFFSQERISFTRVTNFASLGLVKLCPESDVD